MRVADGVYAFITPEERSSFQAGNSVAVIGDDGVLVFDTGNIPSMTRRQIAEIRRLTDKPVRFVVNSHWHPDHTLGNAEYRAAFPGVTVIGTSATRAGILERVPTYVDQMKSFAPIDSVDAPAARDGKDARRQSDARRDPARLGAHDARLRRVHARGGAHDAVGAGPRRSTTASRSCSASVACRS